MLPYLSIVIFLLFFLCCIYKLKFFSIAGIKKNIIVAAFLFKVVAGCFNYYIWENVIGHGDSLRYFNDSKLVYSALPDDPARYLKLVFGYSPATMPADLKYYEDNLNIAWTVPEYHMVRINALLNIFSFGNAYGNSIILSFLYFIAIIAFIKALLKFNFLEKLSALRQFFIFFLPSIVFWCSGLLKEGLILSLFCIITVQLLYLEKKLSAKRILILAVNIFFIFLIRDYLLTLIIPNIIIWYIAIKNPAHTIRIFTIITASIISILLIVAWLQPQLNVLLWLKSEQRYFLIGAPDPDYNFPVLTGEAGDALKKIPYSLNNIFFRPNIFHSSDPFRIYIGIELIFIWAYLFLQPLINKRRPATSPTLLFLLFVSCELLFAYGLITMDADTLSRYRSVPLYFILISIFALTSTTSNRKIIN